MQKCTIFTPIISVLLYVFIRKAGFILLRRTPSPDDPGIFLPPCSVRFAVPFEVFGPAAQFQPEL